MKRIILALIISIFLHSAVLWGNLIIQHVRESIKETSAEDLWLDGGELDPLSIDYLKQKREDKR